jgi:putative ABC transport system ATP-binding protein
VSSAATGQLAIVAEGVIVSRAGKRVLDGASLRVARGEVATLEGPSGSGKSTLLRVLATLTDYEEGVVKLDGVDARTIAPRSYRVRVAYVLQQPPMLEGTVAANVATGPRLRGVVQTEEKTATLLARVGLGGFGPRTARDLSGGEQQRVALARALANEPEVLLLDEPTAALDPESSARIVELVRTLAATGLAVVVVTHSEAHAEALAGSRHRLDRGRVRAEAPAT